MTKKNDIITLAQEHVLELFSRAEGKPLVFHDYNHTVDVVKAAEEIGSKSGLSEKEIEQVKLAAWFHDTGYLITYDGHEEVSATYATDFLNKQKYKEGDIAIVTSAIRATQYPQKPNTTLEQVLCDADLSHLAKKGFIKRGQLLRMEQELFGRGAKSESWIEDEIKFLSSHTYHTKFAQKEYARRKTKNILKLQNLSDGNMKKSKKAKEKLKQAKSEVPGRGVETMFRVTFSNQMALSAIADNKANIMLSINAIIISISLSALIPNFDSYPMLIYSAITLFIVCIATIIFATLSTRPKISLGKFKSKNLTQEKPNLLFFGNFHAMPYEEFEWGMKEMMKDREYLYGSMIKDIYSLGAVLAKKYKYLKICYNIFMYGMILVVLSFLITFLY